MTNEDLPHKNSAFLAFGKVIDSVILLERESCAKLAELVAREIDDTNGTATYIAAAIRARGNT